MDASVLKGLLDLSPEEKQSAINMGLLQAGLGMLARNTSTNPMPAIGAGGMAGLQEYQQQLQLAQGNKLRNIQAQHELAGIDMSKIQREKAQLELDTLRKRREALDRIASLARSGQLSQQPQQVGLPGQTPEQGISPAMAKAFNLSAPQPTAQPASVPTASNPRQNEYQRLMMIANELDTAGLPELSDSYRKNAIALMPKLKNEEVRMMNGNTVLVRNYEDGSTEISPYKPVDKVEYLSTGARQLPKSGLTGELIKGAAPIAMEQTPESRAQLAQAQSHFVQTQAAPTFHEGQWIYKPTAASPTGTAITPEGGTGKPPTEAQAKSAYYAARAARAHEILTTLESGGVTNAGIIKSSAEGVPVIGSALGAAINTLPGVMGGPNALQQQTEQARRDFVNAILRPESGAVISPSEFENAYKQYFPMPGEGPAVREQKRRARELAIQGLTAATGPLARNVETATKEAKTEARNIKTPSKQFTLDDGSKVLGQLAGDGNYYAKRNGKTYRVSE